MRHRLGDTPEEAKVKEKCRHHWIIEGHTGPFSKGVCKLCGSMKEFRNYVPYTARGMDVSKIREPLDLKDNESMSTRSGS